MEIYIYIYGNIYIYIYQGFPMSPPGGGDREHVMRWGVDRGGDKKFVWGWGSLA